MSSTENTEPAIQSLLRRIDAIEARNHRVEKAKAWETSLARKVSILVLTYAVMCLTFWSLGNHPFWANAIVPTLGFFLSTLSLPLIRNHWTGGQ